MVSDEAPLRRLHAFNGDVPISEAEKNEKELPEPRVGDRIMVVRQPWLNLILEGTKTMELRARKHWPGRVWLGMGGSIYGWATISDAVAISFEDFRAREPEHRWPSGAEVPYPHPCGLILKDV